jgi:hypothetical protein
MKIDTQVEAAIRLVKQVMVHLFLGEHDTNVLV